MTVLTTHRGRRGLGKRALVAVAAVVVPLSLAVSGSALISGNLTLAQLGGFGIEGNSHLDSGETYDWSNAGGSSGPTTCGGLAFPGSAGFPELARAQMRYIGAGGSPKVDDPNTLKPGDFTLSLIHQPVGKYAACHSHEVVEHFLVLDGVLTVGWAWGEEVIEARLGARDMVLNQRGRPHGFRNDGVGPVLMSISVGSGAPKPPVYACHPRDNDGALARRFGAAPGRTIAFDPASDDPRQQEFARHIVRHAERRPVWQAGLARLDYVAPPESAVNQLRRR